MMNERSWPDCFPEGCPPANSLSDIIEVFRLTHEKLTPEDFLMYREENPRVKKQNFTNSLTYYQTFGLSIFRDKEELKQACKASGAMKKIVEKKGYIAQGDTRDGVYLPTPSNNISSSTHYTIWLYSDARPWEYFIVCERVS